MRVLRSLGSLVGVMPGEGGLVARLLALSFCLGMVRLFVQTAGGALFLIAYTAEQLPLLYIAVALTVPLISAGYTALSGRVGLPALNGINLGGLLAGTLGLWLLLTLSSAAWPAFAVAVWFEVVWAMTSLALWGLAGSLLNVRQGKRLFGLIAAGDVLAATLGGLLTPALVGWAGVPSLLLGAAAGAGGALVIATQVTRRYRDGLAAAEAEASAEETGRPAAGRRGRYLTLVLALVAVSHSTFYLIDNMFYLVVEGRFPGEAELAGFLGYFWAVVNLLTLLANVFLVGPLIGRFGLRLALLILPVVTGVPAVALAGLAALPAAAAAVFWLIALVNLLDWVFRETCYKSGLLVLYQPLAPAERVRAQTLVEGITQPLAQGGAGLGLLILGLLGFGTGQLAWVLVAMLVGCLILTAAVTRGYTAQVLRAIASRQLTPRPVADDGESTAILMRELANPHPGAAIYALDLLDASASTALPTALERLLAHPAAPVRQEALRRIEARGQHEALGAVLACLEDGQPPAVRGAAARAVGALLHEEALEPLLPRLDDAEPAVRHGALVGLMRAGIPGVLAAGQRLLQLAESGDPADRAMAARVLGEVGVTTFVNPLMPLLADPEPQVRTAALQAAGRLGAPRLWPLVIAALRDTRTRKTALHALIHAPEAVPAVERALPSLNDPEQLVMVATACGRSRDRRAVAPLLRLAESPDLRVRGAALAGLGRHRYTAPPAERPALLRQIREQAALAVWFLSARAALAPEGEDDARDLLARALDREVAFCRDTQINLLALLGDPAAVADARRTLAHPSEQRRAYAVEVIDLLLPPDLKPAVLPLVADMTPGERLRRLGASVAPAAPVGAATPAAWAAELAAAPPGRVGAWTRTCACMLIGSYADPTERDAMLTLIERVITLKTVSIFAETPDEILADVAPLLEEVRASVGQTIFAKGDPGTSLYIIISGAVRIHDGPETLNMLEEREVFGEMALLDSEPRMASATAVSDTHLLRLSQEPFYELMDERSEVPREIIRILTRRLRARINDLNSALAQLRSAQHTPAPAPLLVAGAEAAAD